MIELQHDRVGHTTVNTRMRSQKFKTLSWLLCLSAAFLCLLRNTYFSRCWA
jgi:hypothetical protein